MSERPSSPPPSPDQDNKDEAAAVGADTLTPSEVFRDAPTRTGEVFTPEPVVSEAPTELSLDTPAPVGAKAGSDDGTMALRKVTLVSAEGADGTQDGDSGPKASLRRAESYVGFIVDGRYHIQAVLAQGGMGVVYRARHRVIDKPVAIKILRPELADNREITQRFLTEAQAASSIGNPHIVDITDFGELPDGATYIVMEFLEGEALSQRVAETNRLTPDEIVAIARQTAEGLQGAHDAGIVHRDLKPDNIFLTQRGKDGVFVKVLDFGIAKVASSQNQVTRAGRIFGTPHYMSPEQARGEELDNRSDIYSMGVILYELLAGRVPFDGENPLGILTQHMYTDPVPLNELCSMDRVSVGLEAIVTKCLLKEPWKRYGSMAELDEDLARLQRGEQPSAVEELKRLGGSPSSLNRRLLNARGSSGARTGRWLVWLLLLGAVAATAAIVATPVGTQLREQAARLLAEPTATPSATETVTVPAEQGPPSETVEVALVLSPIDARVYRGATDLGPMPISVRLRRGQRISLAVKRPGFSTRRIEVDGSEQRLAVELTALPGASPGPVVRPPIKVKSKPRVISFTDAGVTRHTPAPAINPGDAGPHTRPKRVSFVGTDSDAGAPPTPRSPQRGSTPTSPTSASGAPSPAPSAGSENPSGDSEDWVPAPLEPQLPPEPRPNGEEPIFEAMPAMPAPGSSL